MSHPPDNKHDQKLQAVLLADSFTTTFRPITTDKLTPKVLCPLNNLAMLDYSIEFLTGAGVEELYVVCSTGGDAVESYLRSSEDDDAGCGGGGGIRKVGGGKLKIKIVKDSSISNAGDALRELDKRNWIQSDPFILISGDVVTNVDIEPILKQHKARKKLDSSAIMTVLLKRVGGWNVLGGDADESTTAERLQQQQQHSNRNITSHSENPDTSINTNNNNNNQNHSSITTTTTDQNKARGSPLRPTSEDLTIALNPQSQNRILLYDSNPHTPSTTLPASFFTTNTHVTIRQDLIDAGIYVCSPDVLAGFSDEFDYLHLTKFISNAVAEEEEGLQSKIYGSVLKKGEYATRIHDPRSYHAVSRDLLRRWCYPVAPDNLPYGGGMEVYEMRRHLVYMERKRGGTKIGRSTVVKGPGMVGSGSVVGEKCVLEETVIGNNCNISDDVTLINSHIWEGAAVEENATITESILCNECVVKRGAVVPRGCIIGRGCVIGKDVILPEFTRVTLCKSEGEENELGDFESSEEEEEEEDNGNCNTNADEPGQLTEEDDVDGSCYDHTVKRVEFTALSDATDHKIVGTDGLGWVWTPPTDDDYDDYDAFVNDDDSSDYDTDDDDDEKDTSKKALVLERMKSQSIGYDATALFRKRMALQREYEEENDDFSGEEYDTGNGVDDISSRLDYPSVAPVRPVDVVNELKMICMDHNTLHPVENLRIELNSFKFSQNATFSDCVRGAMLAILERIEMTSDMSPVKLLTSFKSELAHWGELLQKLCHGEEEEQSLIMALETAANNEHGVSGKLLRTEPSFRILLQTLHDEEILSEDAVLAWATLRKDGNSESVQGKLFAQESTQEFLVWLEEDSDDDSDEDSDCDSDDES